MRNAEKIEAAAADFLAHSDGPAWTEQKQQALDSWLAESTAHRIAFLRLAHVWKRADRLHVLRSPVLHEAQVSAGAHWSRFFMRPAAAVMVMALAVGAGWLGLHGSNGATGTPVQYSTAVGARASVALSDGSRLLLNTDTRLKSAVGEGGRMVWLERGEAFFEVAHDSSRPFVVLAGDRRITVLGTRFSVRRRGNEVDVVVEEGRVQVAPKLAQSSVAPTVVTRNQKVVSEGGNVMVLSKAAAQIDNELSWRVGKLVFDQMTLAEAAAEFNRYNEKKIVIADPSVGTIRIGGSFDASNVVGFSKLLQQGFALAVSDNGKEIRVSK